MATCDSSDTSQVDWRVEVRNRFAQGKGNNVGESFVFNHSLAGAAGSR